jgi:glycosyltransferase involved in cell wall biosynthesis
MPKKIAVITQSHLCRNPRVLKEALLLSSNGFNVTILNATYNKSLSNEDNQLIAGTQIQLRTVVALERGGFLSVLLRLIKCLGNLLVKWLNIQTPLALGHGSWLYHNAALRTDADLYIGHQEMGLYTGVRLLQSGRKVAFDFEDWYSEDLLPGARRSRPLSLIKQLESAALHGGAFCLAPSVAMGLALAEHYKALPPVAIYNTFEMNELLLNASEKFRAPLRMFWFSQTIGPGRGLEHFLELVSKLDVPVEIHLLGKIDTIYSSTLSAILSPAHKLFFHSLVSTQDLPALITTFDIGLALEIETPHSRNLTVTNKFFQYLLAGLPLITTATKGQLEVFEHAEPGFLIQSYDEKGLKEKLERWLNDSDNLLDARRRAINAAYKYCWENESLKLLQLVRDNT